MIPWALACVVWICAGGAVAAKPTPGTFKDLKLTKRSPLSSIEESFRRTPRQFTGQKLQAFGEMTPRERELLDYDVSRESVDVVVPPSARDGSPHGLLVWVGVNAPDPQWFGALARRRLIFVAPNRCDGRSPWVKRGLALDAVHDLSARYRIDPARVYLAGFSAGAHASSHLVTQFPDVFKGALCLMGGNYYRLNYVFPAPGKPPNGDVICRPALLTMPIACPAGAGIVCPGMDDPRPVPRVSAFLLGGFLLLFLVIVVPPVMVSIHPAIYGAAGMLGLLALIVWLIPANLGGGGKPQRPESHYKGRWTLGGPSPLRQELTFTGTRECVVSFWFLGNQSMEFRYDLIGAAGDDVEQLAISPRGPSHPGRPCWAQDEHGPGGFVFMPDKPEGWSFTLRYVLRPTAEKAVRGADLHVEVEPRDAKVTIPDEPTRLPEPAVAWGRLDAPSEALTHPGGN